MSTKRTLTKPSIYVASLSDYNAGRLHGRWIDAGEGADHIRDEIAAMLQESTEAPAEEWAIHDYEDFGSLRLSEWSDLDDVARIAQLLEQHGNLFGLLVDYFGGMAAGIDDAERWIESGYCGGFTSVADYAEALFAEIYAEQLKALPSIISGWIDWGGVGRDLEIGGDIFALESDGEFHIFNSEI